MTAMTAEKKMTSKENVSAEEQVLLAIAKLMEGGQGEDDTCRYLDTLTKIFTKESEIISSNVKSPGKESSTPSTYKIIDQVCFESIMGYLDMRRSSTTRGHATLTTSAYLKVSEAQGTTQLITFFKTCVTKNTHDDLILAFSAAASIFPIVPQICSEMFLMEGFIQSLGLLVNKKWKSKMVVQAALEMLNAACMNTQCREAIHKYCLEWLEEIVTNEPNHPSEVGSPERAVVVEDGPVQQQMLSGTAKNLAAVILAKLQVRLLCHYKL